MSEKDQSVGKKVLLTLQERALAYSIMKGQRARNLEEVQTGLRALEVLEFSSKEKAALGMFIAPNGLIHWDAKAGEGKEYSLEFGDAEFEFVCDAFARHTEWPIDRTSEKLMQTFSRRK